MANILVVEDRLDLYPWMKTSVADDGRTVYTATTREKALQLISQYDFDLVVTDLELEDRSLRDGIDVLRAAKEKDPDTEVIVVTYPGTWACGMQAMGLGAFDYIKKEAEGMGAEVMLRAKATQALRTRQLELQVRRYLNAQHSSETSQPGSVEPDVGRDGIKMDRFREIRIFLASSSELKEDRDAFDLYFCKRNDQFIRRGIYLKVVRWEYFLGAMSQTRLQDEYNKAIRDCDIFVSLFFMKTGKFTEEEFDIARRQFTSTGMPLIYTFFKNADIKPDITRKDDLVSLWAFQEKLTNFGHFYTNYDSIEHLRRQFGDQLDKLLEQDDFLNACGCVDTLIYRPSSPSRAKSARDGDPDVLQHTSLLGKGRSLRN